MTAFPSVTAEIDEKTRELLEREPDKANQNIKVIRANIAHKERARKIKDVGIVKLQSMWNKQLSWKEWWQISRLDKHRSPEIPEKMTAEQAVSWAEQHLFERRSVVHEHETLASRAGTTARSGCVTGGNSGCYPAA